MSSILLVLPIPFRQLNGALHIESQAANGLDRWADNFDRVVAACPIISEAAQKRSSWKWVSEHTLEHKDRIRLVGLPMACGGDAGSIRRFGGRFGSQCLNHDQFYAGVRGKQSVPTAGFLFHRATFKGVDVTLRAIERLRGDFSALRVISFGAGAVYNTLKPVADPHIRRAIGSQE